MLKSAYNLTRSGTIGRWDEGSTVREISYPCGCYYSNNIVLKDENGKERMLIQFSESYKYESACVNVLHAWLTIEK